MKTTGSSAASSCRRAGRSTTRTRLSPPSDSGEGPIVLVGWPDETDGRPLRTARARTDRDGTPSSCPARGRSLQRPADEPSANVGRTLLGQAGTGLALEGASDTPVRMGGTSKTLPPSG